MAPPLARDPSPNATFKFPAFQPDLQPTPEEDNHYGLSSSRSPSPSYAAHVNGYTIPTDRWQPRKEARVGAANGSAPGPSTRHGRQKSLSEAFRTIRTRKGSVSQNAHELADALRAPLSPKLIVGGSVYSRRRSKANRRSCSAVSGT
jgi:solute carrier family 35 protein E1